MPDAEIGIFLEIDLSGREVRKPVRVSRGDVIPVQNVPCLQIRFQCLPCRFIRNLLNEFPYRMPPGIIAQGVPEGLHRLLRALLGDKACMRILLDRQQAPGRTQILLSGLEPS